MIGPTVGVRTGPEGTAGVGRKPSAAGTMPGTSATKGSAQPADRPAKLVVERNRADGGPDECR